MWASGQGGEGQGKKEGQWDKCFPSVSAGQGERAPVLATITWGWGNSHLMTPQIPVWGSVSKGTA